MRVFLNKLAILITLILMFCASASALAQNVSIKTGNRGKPLKSIIEEIEKQTNYLFVYDGSLIDIDKKFNINKENAPVKDILDSIFSDESKISYKVRGNNIILLKYAENQNTSKTEYFPIKIQVVDINSQPVVGAVAYVLGKDAVVMTDIDGMLAMEGLSAEDVIKISCMGFKDYTFQATQDYPKSITLATDTQLLDEVVVVGYGTLSSKEITSSITSISADDMMKGVGGADITKSLQGKIPGLVISQTKSVNDSPQMQLRGMVSIVAGQEPLVVIDGFAGGDIRSLNPEDIKSIDVLKDASAGAIYGTRAAAGVILVTTKSGTDTDGKLNITYSAEMLHKQAYGKPDVMTAEEYVAAGVGKDYGQQIDWWQEGINTRNFSHKHNISLNFGTKKATVYSSFFYEKQDGVADGEWRRDFGGRINAKYTFFNNSSLLL